MKLHRLFAVALVAGAGALGAQDAVVELRPFVGASIPMGSQRDLFSSATLLGVQGAFEVQPTFHLVGTFGWVPVHHKYAASTKNADIAQFDLGVEFGGVRPLRGAWAWRPFAGVGGGGRMYFYNANQLDNTTATSGYGTLGMEFQIRDLAFRFEARDNVFAYRAPIAGVSSATRTDVGLSFGLAYHIR